MSATFITTVPHQEAEVWQFLSNVFAMPEPPPSLTSSAIAWKYFDPHPWWPEGRSYMLKTDQGVAAHGCVTPVRYQYEGALVESLQVIDWAAGRLIPGAGLLVYRKCLELNKGTLLAIGGGEDTLKIIPKVKWFKRKDDLQFYARPLRPWRHFAQGSKDLRAVARLVRNVGWKLSPALPDTEGWTCRRAQANEEVFVPPPGDFIPIVRTRAWFDYLLRCPVTRTELVILENAGRPAGHAFLSDAAGSVRVADFVVANGSPTAAFAALVRYVARQPGAAEITAGSSLVETCQVFSACGLRHRNSVPVQLADPRKQFPAEARIEVTPLIGDAYYWFDRASPFVC